MIPVWVWSFNFGSNLGQSMLLQNKPTNSVDKSRVVMGSKVPVYSGFVSYSDYLFEVLGLIMVWAVHFQFQVSDQLYHITCHLNSFGCCRLPILNYLLTLTILHWV